MTKNLNIYCLLINNLLSDTDNSNNKNEEPIVITFNDLNKNNRENENERIKIVELSETESIPTSMELTDDTVLSSINTTNINQDNILNLNQNNNNYDDDDDDDDDEDEDDDDDDDDDTITQYGDNEIQKVDDDDDIMAYFNPYINRLLEKKDDDINELINKLIGKIKLKVKNINDREKKLEENKNKLILLLKSANISLTDDLLKFSIEINNLHLRPQLLLFI